MLAARPPRTAPEVFDDLRFIRDTMERSAAFTAVSGWGHVLLGVTAIAAAWLAAQQTSSFAWLRVWLAEGLLAAAIGLLACTWKANRRGLPLFSGPARKVALGLAPPLVAGAFLTFLLFRAGLQSALPATWLLLYGAGIMTGGAFSVPISPRHGTLLHAPRRTQRPQPRRLGRLVSGRRLRRSPHSFRTPHRPEARWLDLFHRMASPRNTSPYPQVGARREKAHEKNRGRAHEESRDPVPVAPELPELDRLIHERIRLGIVSALATNDSLSFNDLKRVLKTTDGNLSVHARKLEEAQYISCVKFFEGRVPRTEYRLTAAGRRALSEYLDQMEEWIRVTREDH